MKKRYFGFGLALTLIGASIGLSACSKNLSYANADQYTAGGATLTETVTSVEVEWLSGNVDFAYGNEAEVSFSETSEGKLNERNTLYYWLEGTTLHIKFAQSRLGWFGGSYPSKDLTVTLPQGLILNKLEIDSVSADVDINEVSAREIEVESVSGEVTGTLAEGVRELGIETVSGDVNVVAGAVETFDIETTSGEISLQVTNPNSGSIDSTSGNVVLTMSPSIEGFLLEMETTSGDFSSDFETSKEGNKYRYGTGRSKIELETVSGNISLMKAN